MSLALVVPKLDYCNAIFMGLPACEVRPLQIIENAHLFFDQPKRRHVTPLLVTLLWLLAAARIKLKSLTL